MLSFFFIKQQSIDFTFTIKESSENPRINISNKVIVEIPADIHILTTEELATRDENKLSDGKRVGREIGIKEFHAPSFLLWGKTA